MNTINRFFADSSNHLCYLGADLERLKASDLLEALYGNDKVIVVDPKGFTPDFVLVADFGLHEYTNLEFYSAMGWDAPSFNDNWQELVDFRIEDHARNRKSVSSMTDEELDKMAELPEVFEAASASWDSDHFAKRKKELALSLVVDDGDMVAKAYVELSDEHFVYYYDDNSGLSDAGIHTTGLYAESVVRSMTDTWLNDMRGQKTTLETHINGGGRDTHAICVWLNDCVVVIEDIWFEVKHAN